MMLNCFINFFININLKLKGEKNEKMDFWNGSSAIS